MRNFIVLLIFVVFLGSNEIKIIAVGDIMHHKTQLIYSQISSDEYDFSHEFSEISEFLRSGDLVVGNFESSSNENAKWSGYPQFNTPKSIFKALKDAGFDAISTVNNHTLDSGVDGVLTTIEYAKNADLKTFGTSKNGEQKFEILDIKGVKIALLGYSYGFNGLESFLDTPNKKEMVNFIEKDQIKSDINLARMLGSQFIIIYPHWGNEYQSRARSEEKALAREMIEWGADLVVGSHPHVVQEAFWHEASSGRVGFALMSAGNFISNQRLETINNIRTEQSVALEVVIVVNNESKNGTNRAKILAVKPHPLWISRVNDVEKMGSDKRSVKVFLAKNRDEKRAKKAYEMVMESLKFGTSFGEKFSKSGETN